MKTSIKDELINIFGKRACFNDVELRLYSTDISAPPSLILDKIENMPIAVVKPKKVEELKELLRLCEEREIPVIPRGAATSGYGGTIPAKKGIIVDFCGMNKVLKIDEKEKTVTVEAGAVWSELENLLNDKGLSLRIYPSSALSSTVGGWIANGGGVGIGSYGYGTFKESIVSCEIVTPKGVKTLSGNDINLVFGFSGTTGLITKVKFKVKDLEEFVPILGAFNSLNNLISCLISLSERRLPLWHVSFKNALNVELTVKAVKRQEKRNPFHHEIQEEEPSIPRKNLMLFVYPKHKKLKHELENLIIKKGGEILDEKFAHAVWEERFQTMRLKALGPSLIASEVKIDIKKLVNLVNNFQKKAGNFAIEGVLLKNGRTAVVMAFFLGDERKRGYVLTYSKSLMFLEEGKKMGGSAYAIGMYLTNDAKDYFREDLKKAYDFKMKIDEKGILNPGKIFPPEIDKKTPVKGLVRLISLGRKFGGLLLALEKFVKLHEPEKDDMLDVFICSRCGYCRVVCPRYTNIGWEGASPRGQFYFLKEYSKKGLKPDQRMLDLFFTCTTCEKCNIICSTGIPILPRLDLVIRPMLFSREKYVPPIPFRLTVENILQYKNPAGNPHEERIKWLPKDVKYIKKGELCYWAGCTASYIMKNMAENAIRILNQAGINPVYLGIDEWCCGAPAVLLGRFSDVSDVVKHNLEELRKREVKTVITSCAGCWFTFKFFYPLLAEKLGLEYDLEILHFSQVIEKLIKEGKIKLTAKVDLTVTYHDPCHIGRAGGIFDQPREVLRTIPGVKLVEMKTVKEEANCCGRHVMRYPVLGAKIAQKRVGEAVVTGAKAIVTSCPSCMFNLIIGARDLGLDIDVFDLSDLVALSMGISIIGAKEVAGNVYKVRDLKQIPVLEKEKERWEKIIIPQSRA